MEPNSKVQGDRSDASGVMNDRRIQWLLLGSVFVIATCGLIYELIIGTLASYLLGDSVTQFSTVIGVYLFAMGIGSYLSKFVTRDEVGVFVRVEIVVGLVGGVTAALLFLLFPHIASFRILLYGMVLIIGTLVGLEIPLLLRILKGRLEFRDLVSKVFTFDYIGALLASLLFPLVLVPHLGLVRAGFLFGILNILVAWGTARLLQDILGRMRARFFQWSAALSTAALGMGLVSSDRIMSWSETAAYVDPIIHARSSPYQRIVLTRSGNDLRLYLNGNLQFSSRDEYRYHEALVHPAMTALERPARVLVMGGGDGLAMREILRYSAVEKVTLVDLDPEMTRLFASQELLVDLNGGSLKSPRVEVVNEDAFLWLPKARMGEGYDVVVIDFPDPSNFSLGKLYSTVFYRRLRQVMKPGAKVAIQCTSPFVARKSFWCVVETLRESGFRVEPYHLYVPSFGEWGFVLGTLERDGEKSAGQELPESRRTPLPEGLKFLTEQTLRDMFRFPPDMGPVPVEVNRLNNQMLVRYFEEEWEHYVH